ncbi:DUF4422 domain-containing protein [Roseovarius salinarum]|uniref:DUF4422 domain-containing protein n=1 Tax=Roseovarius salinarum TaxID=1981892 RepID=UPI0018E49610|nr:DUF4422 domain-containing protein [Roseovarius salinarum]
MQATLYTAYHKPASLLKSASVQPIQVGRAGASEVLEGMIGDDTGDNISDTNPRYCELTALYWAWRNDRESTHIGLMHYRRVLDFTGQWAAAQAEVFAERFVIDDYLAATEDWLAQAEDVDMVLPPEHVMGMSVRDNYAKRHQPQDLDIAREVIARDHPEMLKDFDAVVEGRALLLGNMFLMRRDLFDRYCAWLFDILGKVEAADVERDNYNPYQCRYLGFVAERLLTVFVRRVQREETGLKVRRANIVNTGGALTFPYTVNERLNGAAQVNIAFSADAAYVPHAAAMLRTLLDHADPVRRYNFFFLHSDVPAYELEILRTVLDGHPNTTWHEINAGRHFEGSYRSATRAPSNATYNRFLLFELLPRLDRLLYLDVDIIVRGDVAEIFDTDIGDAQVAAVPDYIMTRTLTGPTPTIDPKVPDLYRYQRDVLGLQDRHIARYFNAGVLLLNFKAMDAAATGRQLTEMAQRARYLFRDQDLLNSFFKDSYYKLPARYNVFNTAAAGYARVPRQNHAEAMAAKADPFIIHYAAGDYKPWQDTAVPFAHHYWQALARTPFYGSVVAGLQAGKPRRRRARERLRAAGKSLALSHPRLRTPLLYLYRNMKFISEKG